MNTTIANIAHAVVAALAGISSSLARLTHTAPIETLEQRVEALSAELKAEAKTAFSRATALRSAAYDLLAKAGEHEGNAADAQALANKVKGAL